MPLKESERVIRERKAAEAARKKREEAEAKERERAEKIAKKKRQKVWEAEDRHLRQKARELKVVPLVKEAYSLLMKEGVFKGYNVRVEVDPGGTEARILHHYEGFCTSPFSYKPEGDLELLSVRLSTASGTGTPIVAIVGREIREIIEEPTAESLQNTVDKIVAEKFLKE